MEAAWQRSEDVAPTLVNLHCGRVVRHVQGQEAHLNQTAPFAAMLANRELLLRGLGCNMVALSIKMVVVSSGGANDPNLVGFLAAPALEELIHDSTEDHGNQHQQKNDRHQEITLQVRCLHGVNGRRGSLVGHAVAPWDPR